MTIARRIAAGFTLAATPALIALGAATVSHAEASATNTGPSVSQHHTIPKQNIPQPGSRAHHHHQHHRAK